MQKIVSTVAAINSNIYFEFLPPINDDKFTILYTNNYYYIFYKSKFKIIFINDTKNPDLLHSVLEQFIISHKKISL